MAISLAAGRVPLPRPHSADNTPLLFQNPVFLSRNRPNPYNAGAARQPVPCVPAYA